MRVHYLTWLRNRIGHSSEELALPAHIATIADLMAWLEGKGQNYRDALKNRTVIKVSVNGTLRDHDFPIRNNDEVSFFSAIVGG